MGRISEDGRQLWDLYAHYGQVMYQVQIFELSIRGLFSLVEKDVSAALDDGAVERLFRRPLGKLAGRLGASEAIASDIDQAVRARNQLAHHYILEAVLRVNTGISNTDHEIDSLKTLFRRFEKLNSELEQLQDERYSKLGIEDTSTISIEEFNDFSLTRSNASRLFRNLIAPTSPESRVSSCNSARMPTNFLP